MSSNCVKLIPPQKILPSQIRIPGSKSYTNRALILASIAAGESTLFSPSYSDDSKTLMQALSKFGVEFQEGNDLLRVKGRGGKFLPYKGEINVGPAGTAMRFLLSLCALVEGCEIVLCGSERMHKRPINDLVDALRELGSDIEYIGDAGCPPLKIKGSGNLIGGKVSIPGHQSSQYFSSLLMVGPLLQDGLIVEVDGQQISRSYIDMTFDSLSSFEVHAKNSNYLSYYVQGGKLPKAKQYNIEGDASGASYFWGIAAISNSQIKVMNINPKSAQGDVHFPEILERMGCKVSSGFSGLEGWIEVTGSPTLKGVNADMTLMPDTAQTLAVISATARGNSNISGLSTLRIKETDRIEALHNELKTLGVESEAGEENLRVHPAPLKPGRVKTYDDHRMAMSFAMLGSKFEGIEIEEPEVVAKSFPEYWKLLNSLGVREI
jgi:3-phosphoshikimate 1-carboxyvinyltransferase